MTMAAGPEYDPEVHYEVENDYPWIRAWGQLCRFTEETITLQLRRARAEHAPQVAVFAQRRGDPPLANQAVMHEDYDWLTLLDVDNPETRLWFLDWAHSRDLHLPYEALREWLTPIYAPASSLVR